eukprot:gb/GECH01007024.1/.p1 GENE.gb/GECH01007024.1/~~gb/GECH01007024.1/.p1  ORF type:complete len:806 (+),score=142.02 gb/GECH01007024.1/:1-2418(+)
MDYKFSKREVESNVIPLAERRIKEVIHKSIPIQVDWGSLTKSKASPEFAIEVLHTLGGYFVIMRVMKTIENLCNSQYNGKETIRNKINTIKIFCITDTQRLRILDGTLRLELPLGQGVNGAYSKHQLTKTLSEELDIAFNKYHCLIDNAAEQLQKQLEHILHKDLPVLVDSESFDMSFDPIVAMTTLSNFSKDKSIWIRVKNTFEYIASRVSLQHELGCIVGKLVFRNIPGANYYDKYVILEDGILEIGGNFESEHGIPTEKQICNSLKSEVYLSLLEKKNSDEEHLIDKKTKQNLISEMSASSLLKSIVLANPCSLGIYKQLCRFISSPIFEHCIPSDYVIIQKFLEKYAGLNPQDVTRQKKEMKKTEDLIFGWRFIKINIRGQYQTRFGVITDRALYTFKWIQKKEDADARHIHRIPFDKIELISLGPCNVDVNGITRIDSYKHVLRIETSIIRSKKEMNLRKQIQQSVKGKEIQILRTLAFSILEKKSDPPLSVFPFKQLQPSQICRIVVWSLCHVKDTTPVSVRGIPDVSVADIFSALEDYFEQYESQPAIELSNQSDITLKSTLNILFNSLEDEQIDLEFDSNVNLAIQLRKIALSLRESNKNPKVRLSKPAPLRMVDITTSLREGMKLIPKENIPEPIEIPGIGYLPSPEKIFDQVEDVATSLPNINFPDPPEYDLLEVLEQVGETVANMNLESVPLQNISVPGFNPPKGNQNNSSSPTSPLRKFRVFDVDPDTYEILMIPIKGNENSKELCEQVAYSIHGAVRAHNRPFYVPPPTEPSSLDLPETHVGALCNKMGFGN